MAASKSQICFGNRDKILTFLSALKQKYNLNTPDDWNSLTCEHFLANKGSTILNQYSINELKCMACPEGKLMFKNPKQISGYWETKENVHKFLLELKQRYF